jgi:hypothetical protein
MLSMAGYSQIISAAIYYQEHHEIAMKASELTDALVLSPGCPIGWSSSNTTPSALGFQDSEVGGYSVSSFSLQRLLSPQTQVYYNKTGLWYSNSSLGGGGTLLVPVLNTINYTTAAKILGVNGSYGFHLEIMPTLNVSISELTLNPLRLKVVVRGTGFALNNAALKYFLYRAVPSGFDYPFIEALSGTSQTNSSGLATLEFLSVDGTQYAYSIIVYASLGGLSGVGYRSRQTLTTNQIIPFVEDFENRTVILAHSWDVHEFPPPVAALHFNATFFAISQNFDLRQIQLINSTDFLNSGLLNYGQGKPFVRAQIPTEGEGILVVAYKWGNNYGIVMMPWGISTLGFSVTFGGSPSTADWVATEIRQVTINKIAYQVKVSVWSVKGRELEV